MKTKNWVSILVLVLLITGAYYFGKNNKNADEIAVPSVYVQNSKTYSDKAVGVEFNYPTTSGYSLIVDEGHGICEGSEETIRQSFKVGETAVNYAGCYNENLGSEWLYFIYKGHDYSILFDHSKGEGNALDAFKETVKTIKLN
jgi:hypothetical protein